MRLSTSQMFLNGINSILSQQQQVNKTQLELSTGKKVLTPADDPAAAAQILRINSELTAIDQYLDNADAAEGQLQLEESLIDRGESVLQRVRELVLQANNGSQNSESRAAISVEIDERFSELLDIANSKNAGGEYVFSGFQGSTLPFSISAGALTYSGDDGQRFAQVGASSEIPVSDSGNEVFMRIPSGNGSFEFSAATTNTGIARIGATSAETSFISDSYEISFTQALPTDPVTYAVTDSATNTVATGSYENGDSITFAGASVQFSGLPADGDTFSVSPSRSKDVFTSIRDVVDALTTVTDTSSSQAELGTKLALSLENIDRAMSHFSDVRTSVGSRLSRIDSQRETNIDFTLQLEETLSDTEDADLADSISRLNLQLTALEAAQQSYVSAQGLSLFNYI